MSGRLNLLVLMALAAIVATLAACGGETTPADDATPAGGETQVGSDPSGTVTPPADDATPAGGETQVGSDSSGTVTPPSGDTPAEGETATDGQQSSTVAPTAGMQKGAELATQEYAEALEEAISNFENESYDEIDAVSEELFSVGLLADADGAERIFWLGDSDSWSEDDAEFASEYAETMLQATSALFEVVLRVSNELLHRLSSLRPPEHLSGLHGNFIATYEEGIRALEELVGTLKDSDTEIKSREDLADFEAKVENLEVPEEVGEAIEEACRALEGELEAELERDVNVCL